MLHLLDKDLITNTDLLNNWSCTLSPTEYFKLLTLEDIEDKENLVSTSVVNRDGEGLKTNTPSSSPMAAVTTISEEDSKECTYLHQ